MMKANDKSILQICIDEFEQKTQVELKLVIEPSSYHYKETILLALLVFVFVFWGVLHFLEQDFNFSFIYIEAIVTCGVLYYLLHQLQLIQFFISKSKKRKNVQQRALYHFSHHKMYQTKLRSGLLLYYARLEKKGALVADAGVIERFSKEDILKFQVQFEKALNHKNFVEELGSFIRSLAIYSHQKWPDETGENEISNEIH